MENFFISELKLIKKLSANLFTDGKRILINESLIRWKTQFQPNRTLLE